MQVWQAMKYDAEQDRWYVESPNGGYGLNCGAHLDIRINGASIPCRLELAKHWYVIMDGARFDLRESDQYSVRV